MKILKLKPLAILLASVGMLYSCDDILDTEPESFLASETFYSNQTEIDNALVGVYDGLQLTYNNANFIFGEYRADNLFPTPASTNVSRTSFHNSTILLTDNQLNWSNFYKAIDRANRVIIAGEALQGIKANTLGEAYAIRSKVYFDMIRIWKNVPLFLEPIKTIEDSYRPVTPYDEIMNKVVIPDMLRAESLISAVASPFRFTKASVYAHQAEVYMWLKTDANTLLAEKAIQNLINLNAYSLTTTPVDWQYLFYNQPPSSTAPNGLGKIQKGPELIFSIRFDEGETTVSGVWTAYNGGATASNISPLVQDKWIERFPITQADWEAKYPGVNPPLSKTVIDPVQGPITEYIYGDYRQFISNGNGSYLTNGLGSIDINNARFWKWAWDRGAITPNLDRSDIVMYRYADMILLLAEAKIKLGKPVEALALLNQVRKARQLPAVIESEFGTTKDEQINYLLDERQFELMGEGKRWWDLIRNDKVFEYVNPILASRGINPITPDRLFYPIYFNHIIEARGIYQQNPGWE